LLNTINLGLDSNEAVVDFTVGNVELLCHAQLSSAASGVLPSASHFRYSGAVTRQDS
jgi:hypothetical protein